MFRLSFFAIIFILSQNLYAQSDSVSVFNFQSRTTEKLLVPSNGSDSGFLATVHYQGTRSGVSELPTDSTGFGDNYSNFTRFHPVYLHASPSNFPFRTVVRISSISGEDTTLRGTGTLINKSYLLTAINVASTIPNPETPSFPDKLIVEIFFDNTIRNTLILKTEVNRVYFNFRNSALVVLETDIPIGSELGWMGFATTDNQDLIKQLYAWSIGYPSGPSIIDSSIIYQSEHMHIAFGTKDMALGPTYSFRRFPANGQGGSPLLSVVDSKLVILGILTYTSPQFGSMHEMIDLRTWNQLNWMMEEIITIVRSEKPEKSMILANYPNPFNPVTTIRWFQQNPSAVNFSVYNLLGQLVNERVLGFRQEGFNEISFSGESLPSGTYLYRITIGNNTMTGRMTLTK